MSHTLISYAVVTRKVAYKGHVLFECLENTIPSFNFMCYFPNKIPYNAMLGTFNESLKLQ